jgi:hypothetical protein
MKMIYGLGFSAEDIDNFTLVVHHNVLTAMRSLVQACEDMGIEIACEVRSCSRLTHSPCPAKAWPFSGALLRVLHRPPLAHSLRYLVQDELDQFRDISDQAAVDADVAAIVKALWADVGVQQAYTVRHKFQLHDSAA